MRVVVPLIALLFATSASAQQAKTVPLLPDPSVTTEPSQKNCRDRVHVVREERGLNRLERDAKAEDPLLIAAVHKTIDGCAVLVMRDNTSDVRPLPATQEHRLMPAR